MLRHLDDKYNWSVTRPIRKFNQNLLLQAIIFENHRLIEYLVNHEQFEDMLKYETSDYIHDADYPYKNDAYISSIVNGNEFLLNLLTNKYGYVPNRYDTFSLMTALSSNHCSFDIFLKMEMKYSILENRKNDISKIFEILLSGNRLDILNYMTKQSYEYPMDFASEDGIDTIVEIISDDNEKSLKWIFENYKVNLNYKDEYGNDFYLLAVINSSLKVMKYLENELSWNVNVKDDSGRNSYILAARFYNIKKNIKIINYIVSSDKVDINCTDSIGTNGITSTIPTYNYDLFCYTLYIYINKYILNKRCEEYMYDVPFLLSYSIELLSILKIDNVRDKAFDHLFNIKLGYCDFENISIYEYAICYDHMKVIKFFESQFDMKPKLSTLFNTKYNPYQFAVLNNSLNYIKHLEKEYNWNVEDEKSVDYDNDALFISIKYKSCDVFLHLLDKKYWNLENTFTIDKDSNKKIDSYLYAVKNDSMNIVKIMENSYNYVNNRGYEFAVKYSSKHTLMYFGKERFEAFFKRYYPVYKDEKLDFTNNYNKNCIICSDIFEKSDLVLICDKGHMIHYDCLKEYLTMNIFKTDKLNECIYCFNSIKKKAFFID